MLLVALLSLFAICECQFHSESVCTIRKEWCPVRYNAKCFWIVVRYSGITCSQARQICEEQGAKPADIHSEEHYYMLLGYLRMIASRDAYVQASIGLTYNSKTNTASLTNGTAAPFLKWYPAYPFRLDLGRNACMGLEANPNSLERKQHMFNAAPSHWYKAVICEK